MKNLKRIASEEVIEMTDNVRSNHEAIRQIAQSFPRYQAEEMIARIIFGESVDSAIQSVLFNEV